MLCVTDRDEKRKRRLNESPYEKVGKLWSPYGWNGSPDGLNESPYEKVGKCVAAQLVGRELSGLNESPYEKVGKFRVQKKTSKGPEKPQ